MFRDSVERKVLKNSFSFLVAQAIITIVVGFLVSAQTILAEGISSLVALITTSISIFIVKFISKRNEKKYPFGKESLEPFVGVINYCLMLFICIMVIIDAIQVIASGGNDEIHITSSILFGVFYVMFTSAIYIYLKSLIKSHTTPISELEVVGWKFSIFTSIGMVLGFSLSWVLNLIGLYTLTAYVDPILAIILMLVFASTPILELKSSMLELMQARPSEEITDTITRAIENADRDYDFVDKVLRFGKIGNLLRIEIDYVIEKSSGLDSIAEQDKLRKVLTQACDDLFYEKWINIGFTSEVYQTKHML